MSTLEIKGGLHELIVRINDKKLLMMLQEIILEIVSQKEATTDFWDELPIEKQKELDEALVDIESEENLISQEQVFQKYQKWLKK